MAIQDPGAYRDRPIGEVVSELAGDVSLLVRQEVELAKAEMREKAKIALPGLGMMGGAGVVALCAAGALTAFVVLALATFLDAWLAALVTALGLALVAAALVLTGKERVADAGGPLPGQTIENVKEDAQWVKERAISVRR